MVSYAEMDPSGRYGRLNEILGKGAMKTVYKAFDQVLGMEVAWCQVMQKDMLSSSVELQRMYTEVHLLNSLDHESIVQFYKSWIDTNRGTVNFITEMLTSGTLREYREKFKEVDIRAIKNWARQILRGVAYLHGLDPLVIHRDLKCDNIFVNGHLGQVKIGDFGLAAVKHAHSLVGTPEFMAPEIYTEKYNELVDVYSFGMCVLEMFTCEYPYSECSNALQIINKVKAGIKPEGLYRIQNAEVQRFIAKCLEHASTRPSAYELLRDPFLAQDDDPMPLPGTPLRIYPPNEGNRGPSFIFGDHLETTDMTITGTVNTEDDAIYLKVRICYKGGVVNNAQFSFDFVKDTSIDVAMEMVKELKITHVEPHDIAKMIEDEFTSLVPEWKAMTSPKSSRFHSYKFEDSDNEHHSPPYLASDSPSYVSTDGFANPSEEPLSLDLKSVCNIHEMRQGPFRSSENSFSEASTSSTNGYSDIEYFTQKNTSKAEGSSRFCPKMSPDKCNGKRVGFSDTLKGLGSSGHKKFSKIRSLLDIRSQLIHRAMMQALNKRRSGKSIGAVESIGFHDPI